MTAAGWLPADPEDLFGAGATAEEAYDLLTVDVPPAAWLAALEAARDRLGCAYFDWLSAVDEPGTGFRVAAHVAALAPVRRLLLRTTVPHEAPALPSAVGVYAGAAWHERETHEMFGVDFTDHPGLDHLLLPESFEGHPLRKDFVLAARVAKAWPGAKEPGESEHGGPRRRQMLPPGVPDPNEWGPLKGQLPPAPARPTRTAGERPARRTRTAAEGSAGQPTPASPETPASPSPRRSRTASQGSASQTPPTAPATPESSQAPASPAPRRARAASQGSASQTPPPAAVPPSASEPPASPAPRRARSASDGSASQQEGSSPPRPSRTAGEGPASQRPAPSPSRRSRTASQGSASQRPAAADTPDGDETPPPAASSAEPPAPPAEPPAPPRSPDAPWHHARPAFEEETPAEPKPAPRREPAPDDTGTPPDDTGTPPADPDEIDPTPGQGGLR
ncbi:NADH-quinone oxidoreductase subunit C [Streptomyces sp. NPDC048182]|uniref:NADH-quinone oxidoreductase subunit C n=1 Tax=Streptomyces sp. NPDC048182 TaxID=3365507 RepID=UPI003723FFB4